MIRYHVFYQREDTGFLDCLDVYANDIGEAFCHAKDIFKDHNIPTNNIIGITKKDIYEKES